MSSTRHSVADLARARRAQARQLGVEEGDVEGGVVDHQLGAADERRATPRRSRAKRGFAVEVGARDAVHGERALVDVALGIQVAMEGAAGGTPVHQLDAADLDDAVVRSGSRPVVSVSRTIWRMAARVYRNAGVPQRVDRLIRQLIDALVARHARNGP